MTRTGLAAALLAIVPLSAQQESSPIAWIDRIVSGGKKQDEVPLSEASVIRSRNGGQGEPARAGTQLYRDDEVRTGSATQIIVLFMDNPAQRSNQVTIDSGSRVRVVRTNGVFLFLGRLLANVRGLFEVRTETVNLGARGTVFEAVRTQGGRSDLLVVDGAVEMVKGDFSSPGAAPAMEFSVASGTVRPAPARVTILNSCNQTVRFEVRPPGNLRWVRLRAERVEVEPGARKSVDVALSLDARRISAGAYRGELVADCRNCGRLRGCTQDRYSFPVVVRVVSAPVAVQSRQEAAGGAVPRAADGNRFAGLLRWNNELVVASRPTFPPEGLAPYFRSLPERQKILEDSAAGAFWRNDPAAFEALGDLYLDWSDAPKALDLYRKAAALNPARKPAAPFQVKLGESLRGAGLLDDAERALSGALAAEPRLARAHNAMAALSLDRARIASYLSQSSEVRRHARNAEAAARRSLDAGPETPSAWTNLGEACLMLAQYDAAIAAFNSALARNPQYSLAHVGLGKALHALGLAAMARGDRAAARGLFEKGRDPLHRAMNLHPDLAEAHVALGDLERDADPARPAAAIEHYRSAIGGRPRNPAAYFRMGEILERTDPEQAGQYFRAYLRLENPAFLQGERQRRAEAGARLGRKPE